MLVQWHWIDLFENLLCWQPKKSHCDTQEDADNKDFKKLTTINSLVLRSNYNYHVTHDSARNASNEL
jgi:hypothetical protein